MKNLKPTTNIQIKNDQTKIFLHAAPAPILVQFDEVYLGSETMISFNGIPWTEFLALSYLIFLIGLSGIIFNFKNFLVTMFSIELMYLGITISFILVSVAISDPKGQIYAMVLLILAAAESAIGLGILIVLFRFGKSIDFESYQELKG